MDKLNSINILITGSGAPGIKGTIYSLRNNFDRRKVILIGTDIDSNAVGKFLCDKFFVIPPSKSKELYLKSLFSICKDEKVDVILPQNTFELELLSKNVLMFKKIKTQIVIASQNSINIANDKFHLMNVCQKIGVPVGSFYKVNTFDKLVKCAENLGWPAKNFVVKPPVSNGMRGVRIISEKINRKDLFYNEKPNSLYLTLNDLKQILGHKFPDLIVTEYLPGDEYTVDVFRSNNQIVVIPRIRHKIKSGITFFGEVKKHDNIIKYCQLISEELNLKNCYGFQFKLDQNGIPKILESNPRVQGSMILATLANANIIYASIKQAMGEKIPKFKIKWGAKLIRYWGGVGVSDKIIDL